MGAIYITLDFEINPVFVGGGGKIIYETEFFEILKCFICRYSGEFKMVWIYIFLCLMLKNWQLLLIKCCWWAFLL